jgi:chromosome segregation ATPase
VGLELIEQENIVPAKFFAERESVDGLIDKIKKQAESLVADVNVSDGRKQIRSLAYQIARSKTFLDELGKNLVRHRKAEIKLIDDHRRLIRNELDNLKKSTRQPLTDWENEEKERKAAAALRQKIESDHESAIEENRLFDERRRIEAEKVEIERQRREEEERQRVAAEQDRIRREAEEKARLEAEARVRAAEEERIRAKLEKEKAEADKIVAEKAKLEAEARAKQEKKAAAERAERDRVAAENVRIAAEKRAERERLAAVEQAKYEAELKVKQAEEDRINREAAARAAEEARIADENHRSKIHGEIVASLEEAGFNRQVSIMVVEAITEGINHVKIEY